MQLLASLILVTHAVGNKIFIFWAKGSHGVENCSTEYLDYLFIRLQLTSVYFLVGVFGNLGMLCVLFEVGKIN